LHLLRVVGLKAIVENVKLTLLGLFRIHVAHFACFGLFSIQDHAQCLHCTLHKSAWFGLFAKKNRMQKTKIIQNAKKNTKVFGLVYLQYCQEEN